MAEIPAHPPYPPRTVREPACKTTGSTPAPDESVNRTNPPPGHPAQSPRLYHQTKPSTPVGSIHLDGNVLVFGNLLDVLPTRNVYYISGFIEKQ